MHFRPFEIILIGIFAVSAVAGLVFLSLMKGGGSQDENPYGESVLIWGTLDQGVMDTAISNLSSNDAFFGVVEYRRIDERRFESELLNAIAEGNAPDLVLLPHTLLVSFREKLTAIPNETLDARTMRDTYVDGAGIFMQTAGTYALPFAVDPLVLFWNRDLFSGAGLAQPPKTWELLVAESVPALTKMDSKRVLVQSAIALGEYQNVNHAKEILSTLFFQAGTSIAGEDDGNYIITLNQSTQNSSPPARAALMFYSQFSNPGSNAYTWSRIRQLDRNSFTAGTLSMYLGLGSEIEDVEDENPNLNFDIAPVPQSQGATALRNYGTFYGFAIPKASRNVNGAFNVAIVLAGPEVARELTRSLGLTPVHRVLYGGVGGSVYSQVLEQSALIARGWLDPSPIETDGVFKRMIEATVAGQSEIERIISDATYDLETLFR
jgi:ABC-type glycerol-3-phosphate transport system substrate-binding protein